MSMDELTPALCRQSGALRDRGADSQADDLEQAATELVRLRAEITRLRWRLSDAETVGAAVVRHPVAAPLPWGRDDLMAIAAVRYCLGRQSYIVGDCADWLHAQWPHISAHARSIISRDIDEAFTRDDAARASGSEYLPLGMDIDRRVWEGVRRMWQDENKTEGAL